MVEPSSKTNDAHNQIGGDALENGDLITHYLEKIGVKYVFGLPYIILSHPGYVYLEMPESGWDSIMYGSPELNGICLIGMHERLG